MADILIKNMEMPKDNKRVFLCIEKDGEVGVFEEKKLIRFTEAQELPPHGDLIQRDNLLEFIEKNEEVTVGAFYDFIQDAPTILEATNE